MSTSYTLPTAKIGNHPLECPCGTCTNARKRLAKSPYVQLLQAELLAAHKRLGEESHSTPNLAPDHEILRLREEIDKSRDGERVLKNALDESRKITQEREGQLASAQATSRTMRDKMSITQTQLRHAQEETEVLAAEVKRLTDLQSLTADELAAALAGEEHWQSANSDFQASITKLQRELISATDQRDQERSDHALKIKELREMLLPHVDASAADQPLRVCIEGALAKIRKTGQENERNSRLVSLLGSIVIAAALAALALWIRSMGGAK